MYKPLIRTRDAMTKKQYLNKLKKELAKYKKELSDIQKEFRNNTGEHVQNINQSLKSILQEATLAYEKLESASATEWKPLQAATNEAFDNLRNSFQEQIQTSKLHLQGYGTKAKETCEEQLACAEQYVKKHPLKSILLAAGAGFIIGKIFKWTRQSIY